MHEQAPCGPMSLESGLALSPIASLDLLPLVLSELQLHIWTRHAVKNEAKCLLTQRLCHEYFFQKCNQVLLVLLSFLFLLLWLGF